MPNVLFFLHVSLTDWFVRHFVVASSIQARSLRPCLSCPPLGSGVDLIKQRANRQQPRRPRPPATGAGRKTCQRTNRKRLKFRDNVEHCPPPLLDGGLGQHGWLLGRYVAIHQGGSKRGRPSGGSVRHPLLLHERPSSVATQVAKRIQCAIG